MREFNYEITEHIATISENDNERFTLELNRISYNGGPAKLDLRHWDREKDKMLKGLTLSREEAESLSEVLVGLFSREKGD